MLRVRARIFDDNQLVGYLLTDGKVEKPVTREQAWKYAKNKMIENVVAVGSANVQTPFGASNSASLSGKNGFELKSLPKIEDVCNSNEIYEMKEELRDNGTGYTIEERELLIGVLIKIRKAMNKHKLDAMKNAIKEAVCAEMGVSNKFGGMSPYVTVVATLYDSKCKEINKRVYTNAEERHEIIGYRIKYTGENSLFIQRKPKAEDSMPCVTELKTNEECNLNFMETTQLAAKPEFSFMFANGKLKNSNLPTKTLEEQQANYRVNFDNKVPEIDIRTCDTEENIDKIFNTMNTYRALLKQLKTKAIDSSSRYILKLQGIDIGTAEDRNRIIEYLEEVLGEKKVNPADSVAKSYVEQMMTKMNGTEQKLKQANSPKGIFDAFKR